ncbi:hypothetical protein BDD12DRAFT_514417 [Trichophaea hybrida]|nr:hypothetical protein BDD12DRAFT_514417 [Trichophaea hybrida]
MFIPSRRQFEPSQTKADIDAHFPTFNTPSHRLVTSSGVRFHSKVLSLEAIHVPCRERQLLPTLDKKKKNGGGAARNGKEEGGPSVRWWLCDVCVCSEVHGSRLLSAPPRKVEEARWAKPSRDREIGELRTQIPIRIPPSDSRLSLAGPRSGGRRRQV